ncbi:glycosyltransferase family 2 protein [Gracilimonas tropica]|uniref:glycosyltransferase family 2 protein n=1 Tax=Gracilimonas tropica TaxID=454600 RepID=UPI000374BD82|nr:glycosyltransferase family 2 protein [Gracilimonas tropica]
MDFPKISIVTPSYNQVEFLERTIQSVLNQNYPNLEYIIIDGGSTDGSVDIIKKYENQLNFWVSEPDNGQTEAINKGLSKITGDIWAYLCSDDTYEPNTLNLVAEFFSKNKSNYVLYGDCNFINERDIVTRKKTTGNFSKNKLKRKNFIYQPSVFLKKEVLEECGLFEEDLHYTMDYEYWLRISDKYEFSYMPVPLANYRLHDASKTVDHVVKMKKEDIKVKKEYGYGWHAWLVYFYYLTIGAKIHHFKQKVFNFIKR